MGVEELDFSDIAPEEDIQAVENPNEAPVMAQVGRGMVDVYEGTSQVAAETVLQMRDTDEKIDTLYKPGSVENFATKALLAPFYAIKAHTDPISDKALKEHSAKVSAETKLYNKNNPDFQIARVGGSIATPLTLIPGANAKTLGGKILTGMGTGSVFSMTQPVEDISEFWARKGEQAKWGAAFGGALPVAGSMLGTVTGWIDELTKPLYKSGVVRDVTKFLKDHITQNKDKIIKAINKSIKAKDIKNVRQKIAETTQGTGDDFGGMLVRLEKDLARESDSLKSLYARQSQGRRKVIDALAGSEDDYAAAIQRRAQQGDIDYKQAFKAEVMPDEKLSKLLSNKFSKKAINEANALLEAKGEGTLSEALHLTKLGLDKQLAKHGDEALSSAEKKIVGKLKDNLVTWIEKNNPAYARARTNYQKASAPINKMEVGRELRNKLVNSLDTDTPSVFANALRDSAKLLKTKTGAPRYSKLEDIIGDDAVTQLKNVAKELVVEKKAATMAGKSGSVIGKMKSELTFDLPHILSRPVVITNHILKKFGRDVSTEYKEVLSTLVRNPDEFVRLYGGPAKNAKTQHAMDIVRRLNTLAASQQAGQNVGEEFEEEDTSVEALDFSDI